MTSRSSLVTLVAGGALAAVLYGLSARAAVPDEPLAAVEPAAPASASASATPAPSATTPVAFSATYVGHVEGGGASVGLVVKDGSAAAYVCDGRRIEAWLQGTAAGGRLALKGPDGETLTGGYGVGGASGDVVAGGRQFSFDVATVRKPGGLYRASRQMRQGLVVAGWIVQADGTQVGIAKVAGVPEPGPRLDTSSLQATLDGERLTAVPVDGGPLDR